MGICASDNKKFKKKKNPFGLRSTLERKLDSILDKQYAEEDYHVEKYMQNFNDITHNRIEDSLVLSNPQEDRSHSVLNPKLKSPKLKKKGLKRKKKPTKVPETEINEPTGPKKTGNEQNKAIILQKVPLKAKKLKLVTKQDAKEENLLNTECYEMLENLDKSNNLVSKDLDYEVMNEEFIQLKDFVDKKLELLSKKNHQLNLLKKGLQTHYSKETSTDLEMNLLSKQIDKKLERLNSKTENLNNMNDQLYKFMSNSHGKAQTLNKAGFQQTLDQITHEDVEIHQYQKTLTRRGSGLISPSLKYLNNIRKKSSIMSPCPLFGRQNSHLPSPMILSDITGINSGMLKQKVEKKLEKVEMNNQLLEFLTERLKKGKSEDKEEIKELMIEVKEKIIGKLRKVNLEDLEKEGGLEDSQGLVVWSDTE